MEKNIIHDLRLADIPDVTQFGWKLLLKAVSQHDIKTLDLSYNGLGRYGTATGSPLRSLAGMKLKSLNLAHNKITGSHTELMLEELKREKTKIDSVKLSPGNEISDTELDDLSRAMAGL